MKTIFLSTNGTAITVLLCVRMQEIENLQINKVQVFDKFRNI